jgi:hypothetical protein
MLAPKKLFLVLSLVAVSLGVRNPDCWSLCDHLSHPQGFVAQPLHIWAWETGTCTFEPANLSPYHALYVDPIP